VIALATVARSQIIGTDNFNYTPGPLNGETGGTGWVLGDNPGDPATNWYDIYGNEVEVTAPGTVESDNGAIGRSFGDNNNASAIQGTGAIYFSVDLTFDGTASADATDYSVISALDYGTERVQFGRSYGSSTYDIGVTSVPSGNGPANGTVADTGVSTAAVSSVELVGSIQYETGSNSNGVLKLWVNPTTSDFDTVLGTTNTGSGRNTTALAVLPYGNTDFWTNGVRLASGANAPTSWSNVKVASTFAAAEGASLPTQKNITVMPLGDSITWGQNVAGGYETRLFQDLQGTGHNTTYVGSVTNNASTVLTNYGETHEEGHPGCFTSYIYNNLDGNDNSDAYSNNDGGYWLTSNGGSINNTGLNPNYILLMVGTNDIGFGNGATYALNELGLIINKLSTLRPNAHILVSNLLPREDSASVDAQITGVFNPAVPGIVAAHDAEGQHVSFVDMYDEFAANTSAYIGSDGVHPTQAGYNLMGDTWYSAISNLEAQSVPEPTSFAIIGACMIGLCRRRRRSI